MKRNRTGGRKARRVGAACFRDGTPIVSLALAGYLAGCVLLPVVIDSPLRGPPRLEAWSAAPDPLGPRGPSHVRADHVASSPPPPISGGTLLATRDGAHAVAADPERDSVYVVDLKTHAVTTMALTAGDEPGRVVEDGAGRIHVALRSGGALATIDASKGSLLARRDVCAAPRGVAWDASHGSRLGRVRHRRARRASCGRRSGGENIHVERDLRDVIVGSGSLAVTKFRSAEVLRIASHGTITRRDPLPSPDGSFAAHVAWRTVAGPSGTVVAVHQAESTSSVVTHGARRLRRRRGLPQGAAFLPPVRRQGLQTPGSRGRPSSFR